MNPDKQYPDGILATIRGCIHSQICASQPKGQPLFPDYKCTKLNKTCVLYTDPFCEVQEPFPDTYNT